MKTHTSRMLQGIFCSFLLLAFAGAWHAVYACSCRNPTSPCEALGSASAVFIGRVTDGARQSKDKDKLGNEVTYIGGQINFAVEISFSGPSSKTMTIHSDGGCGRSFVLGRTYLVYAYGDLKTGFSTSICTRTRLLSEAAEDMAFLDNLQKPGVGVHLSGYVYRNFTIQETPKPHPVYDGVPDILVVAKNQNGEVFKTKTNEAGAYEFKALKPGQYEIEADLPKEYYRGGGFRQELKIGDRGCGEASFSARFDGLISGKVVDKYGRPVPKIEVVLINADDRETPRQFHEVAVDYADTKGGFRMDAVQPGRYRLGINVNQNPDEHPFPPTWYPGVTEKLQGTVLEIGVAEKVRDLIFQLPEKLMARP